MGPPHPIWRLVPDGVSLADASPVEEVFGGSVGIALWGETKEIVGLIPNGSAHNSQQVGG